jgi:hypothetical protein
MSFYSFAHFAYRSKIASRRKLARMASGKPRKASGQPKPRVVVSKPVTRGKWVPLPVGSDQEARFSQARVSGWAREISKEIRNGILWSRDALEAIWDIVADDHYHLMLEAEKLSKLEKLKTVRPRHVEFAGKTLMRN